MRVTDILAREAKVPSLSFTGGEPTLRSDLPRFVAHAARRGLRVNLITNGVLCADERLPRALARAGLSSAQVSIEGPDAETHDSLTRRPGSFDLSLRGLRNLRAAGVKTHCNTTVCRANAGRLEAIADLAASLHLERISMNLIIPAGTSAAEGAEALQVRYREIGPLALAAKARAEALGLEFHWYSPTPMCLFNPIAHALGNKGCAACDGLIHVAPDGRVLPCSSFRPEESVGDLLRDGFEAVWFGEKAQFFKTKRQAPSGCRSCDRFALCQGACPLYWREMGCEELEHAAMRMEAAES